MRRAISTSCSPLATAAILDCASVRECPPTATLGRWHPVRVDGLDALSTDELVARYALAAKVHGEATVTGGQPANKEADFIAAAYRELRRRGSESALLSLLESEDENVSGWAAAHALEFAPEQSEPVLVRLAESPGLLGFDARMTLREWRAGRLRFPGRSLTWASVQECPLTGLAQSLRGKSNRAMIPSSPPSGTRRSGWRVATQATPCSG